MAETIYTIPINEAFEKHSGCPFCGLHDDLERDSLEYVMGAAMMQPDVREETNRIGFCRNHLDKMMGMKNRLGLALLLESHMALIEKLLEAPVSGKKSFFGGSKDSPTPSKAVIDISKNCFVCNRMSSIMERYMSNAVYLWKSDGAFREKFANQKSFCMEHTGMLLATAGSELDSKQLPIFNKMLLGLMKNHTAELKNDLTGFIKSFDHRNAGKTLTEEERKSVENIIIFLRNM